MEIKNQTGIIIREASETDASQISDLITRTVLEFQDEDLTKQGKKYLSETMTPEAISDTFLATLIGTMSPNTRAKS